MKTLPIVAIIGQTNAGKSTLLNRLARKNIAITAREQGTTRDNVIAKLDDYILIDTAGLKNPEDDFEETIQDQIADAINSADLILLTLDSTKYINQTDKMIAKKALKSKKPVLLALNKSDLKESLPESDFLSLGIKPAQTVKISATTGQGTNELKQLIQTSIISNGQQKVSSTDSEPKGNVNSTLKIALIGRPNVGKSSLFNSIAKKQQAIVSSRQGTTRDINRIEIRFKNQTLEFLDTAGLRKPGKREVGIEKFSALRTLAAIEEADICLLLVDATEPSSKLDQTLAGQIVEAGKSIILVVTKTDLDIDTNDILNRLEYDFNFIPYAPAILTSSETGKNVTKIFDLATTIAEDRKTELKTSDLNKILENAVQSHPPAGLKNTRPKLRYITQTDSNPPWFVVYGSELQLLHWSYKRYLERKIREAHPFIGTPIFFSFKNRGTKGKKESK